MILTCYDIIAKGEAGLLHHHTLPSDVFGNNHIFSALFGNSMLWQVQCCLLVE